MRHQVSITTPFYHTSSPQTCTLKLNPCARFWVFVLKLPSPTCICDRDARDCTTSSETHHHHPVYHPPLPFDMAGPEPSLSGLVSGFWPSTPSPRLRLRKQCPQPPPLRARHNTTILHHQPLPFDTAGPEPSLSGLVSGFWPSTPSPHLRLRTQQQQLFSPLYL